MSDKETYKTKMISFKPEYHQEYYYLLNQGNASRLVCELVRAHRLNEETQKSIDYGKEQSKKEKYTTDIVSSAKELLNM